MEIRTEPSILNVDINVNVCPCCNNRLQQEIRSGKYLIGDECGYCRYFDRPFCVYGGNIASSHYGGCSCKYGKKDYLYISCKKCLSPKCRKCGVKQHCSGSSGGCNNIICSNCEDFVSRWNSSPKEKLNTYGIIKLRKLAKNKEIKFSRLKKQALIDVLNDNLQDKDFLFLKSLGKQAL